MKFERYYIICFFVLIMNCENHNNELNVSIYETSKSGHQLTEIENFKETLNSESVSIVKLDTNKKYQKITGFGGAFTESSAYLLNKISKEKLGQGKANSPSGGRNLLPHLV